MAVKIQRWTFEFYELKKMYGNLLFALSYHHVPVCKTRIFFPILETISIFNLVQFSRRLRSVLALKITTTAFLPLHFSDWISKKEVRKCVMSLFSSIRGKISNLLRPFSTNKHLRYGFPIIGLLVGSHLYLSIFPLDRNLRKRSQDTKSPQLWLSLEEMCHVCL